MSVPLPRKGFWREHVAFYGVNLALTLFYANMSDSVGLDVRPH